MNFLHFTLQTTMLGSSLFLQLLTGGPLGPAGPTAPGSPGGPAAPFKKRKKTIHIYTL